MERGAMRMGGGGPGFQGACARGWMAALVVLLGIPNLSSGGEPPPDWADAVRRTHARFTGRTGTLALFGDSISVSLAFWAPLQAGSRRASPDLDRAVQQVRAHLKPECWRDWRGPAYGNDGGRTAGWAVEHVGEW